MDDFIEEYMERVRKRLSRQEQEPVIQLVEALCFPSFHPETLLRVASGPTGTTFQMATLTSSLWYSNQEAAKGVRPERMQEVASVASERAVPFWNSILELKPEAIQSDNSMGADGMSVRASYRQGESLTSFETWSPAPESPCGKFVHLICDLAWAVLKEKASIERLEQLHGYLSLGLPARLIPGDVTCLRLFSSLASYHAPELQRFFANVPVGTPLIVDMTNFDGMGTLLYPIFVEFASARRLLAWVGSTNAKRHIESMRLPSPQIFENTEAASEWIRQKSRESGEGSQRPN